MNLGLTFCLAYRLGSWDQRTSSIHFALLDLISVYSGLLCSYSFDYFSLGLPVFGFLSRTKDVTADSRDKLMGPSPICPSFKHFQNCPLSLYLRFQRLSQTRQWTHAGLLPLQHRAFDLARTGFPLRSLGEAVGEDRRPRVFTKKKAGKTILEISLLYHQMGKRLSSFGDQ